MTPVKFEQSLYKAFEPAYQAQRPIIVDEALESPETVTLRYEEEAVRTNRGDLRGESPPGLLPMATYKPQPSQIHAFTDSPYSPYSTQSFSTQQTDSAPTQLNQIAFATGNTAGQYTGVSINSCHPSAGGYGTRVILRVSTQYDLQAMAGSGPYAYVSFGLHRVVAQIVKDSQLGGGACTYTVGADVPQLPSTSCPSPNNVPLTLTIEGANGEELARVDNAGVFTYYESHGASGAPGAPGATDSSGDASPPEDLTRKSTQSPEQRTSPPHSLPVSSTATTSPSSSYNTLPNDPTTNSYGYPPAVAVATAEAQAQAHVQPNFAAAGYTQGTNSMLGAYRSSSFADHYSRAPPPVRSSRWAPYSNNIGTVRSPATTTIARNSHAAATRPSLTALVRPSAGVPQLIRTSTLSSPPGAGLATSSGYNPYAGFPTKATLKIDGDLESMAENWTQEEWGNKRRIVLFRKSQQGSQLQTSFRPVGVDERRPSSTCISCIWWAEKQECYVTSVDTIYLLEQLVAAPARFTVEEKNRIRRNLEGFHPLTVSKTKADSAEFFKVIMSFGNPKPRNIEKDVKVFPWKILGQALKKIISKYSASPSATMTPSTPRNLLTPISASGPYEGLAHNPMPATAATDPTTATGYITSSHHHPDSLPSPRTVVAGVSSSWTPYGGGPGRTLSPDLRTHSPHPPPGFRFPTLPSNYDSRAPYGLPSSATQSHQHHAQGYNQSAVPVPQNHGRIWDGYTVPGGYTSHTNHSTHGQAYAGGAYHDGLQRV